MAESSAWERSKISPVVQNTASSSSRQQTISQLFSASQQEQGAGSCQGQNPSPFGKRRRSSQHPLDRISPSIKPAAQMYNFASSRANGKEVIDLTSSPSASPHHKARKLSVSAKVENTPSAGGPKQFNIKNQRASKSDPSQFCRKTFAQLDAALSAIFKNERPSLSNEELYRGAENLCKLGQAEELARKLIGRCKEHVVNHLRQPLLQIAEGKAVEVLRAVLDTWSVWMKQVGTIRSIFIYLDRSHLLQTQSPSIYESAVSQFRSHIFRDPMFGGKIVDGACDLLLFDRQGRSSEETLFSATVKMLHDLQTYTSEFEPRMLSLSQDYIRDWADAECAARELPDYVAASVALMKAEMERCDTFALDSSTQRALLTLLEQHLIERHEAELTDQDSVADILDKEQSEATRILADLYSLLARRRLGAKLKTAFSLWIDDTGTEIVFNDKDQEKMVTKLLEFKQKLDHIWRFAFQKDNELGQGLRTSFEAFMNKSKKSAAWNTDNSRTGEMIAKYVDMLLKAGAKAIPLSLKTSASKPAKPMEVDDNRDENEDLDEDAEVDNQLDQVLDLFRFVHGKAVFEAFYKKDLARRLLMGRSASNDAEKNMLSRLKTECGAGFTQNLEQMFKDIELAEDDAKAYKMRLENSAKSSTIDLSVNILSAAAWPTYPDIPVAIPPAIAKCITDFESFYYMKHSGRKLSWKHALAHCQMRAEFPKGRKDLVVSSFQALVLLLFNDISLDEHLSYEHIKATTALPEAEVKRTLQSLACAKLRPLTKHPRGREINAGDTFTLNASFSHDKFRVKINAIQLKETKEENKETHVRVAADRQFETQAAIVRIMKSKKTITHAQLIGEVINATKSRGVLQPADIKKEIDKLIEKEYLEREEGNMYNYLA